MKAIELLQVFVVAGTLVCAHAASGAPGDCDYRSTGTGGDWETLTTWECYEANVAVDWVDCDDLNLPAPPSGCRGEYPGEGSGELRTVTILAADTVTLATDVVVQRLNLDEGESGGGDPGELVLYSGDTASEVSLTIGDTGGGTLAISYLSGRNSGRLTFDDDPTSGSYPAKLILPTNETVSGDIRVDGTVGGCIDVASGKCFTLGGTGVISGESGATGELQIRGSGTFENDGEVNVDRAIEIELLEGGPELVGSSGEWNVSYAGGTLRFTTAGTFSTVGSGDFIVSDGTLAIDATLSYPGGLRQSGGKIQTASTKTLTVTGVYTP